MIAFTDGIFEASNWGNFRCNAPSDGPGMRSLAWGTFEAFGYGV